MKYYVIAGIGYDMFYVDRDSLIGEVVTPSRYLSQSLREEKDGSYCGGCRVITGPLKGEKLYFAEVALMKCN